LKWISPFARVGIDDLPRRVSFLRHKNVAGRTIRICTNKKREFSLKEMSMANFFRTMWSNDEGQDIAEYAVMLAVILVIVVGTIRLIGGTANNVFSSVASSIGS
jgi:Flp pilus assembly pilin Flp